MGKQIVLLPAKMLALFIQPNASTESSPVFQNISNEREANFFGEFHHKQVLSPPAFHQQKTKVNELPHSWSQICKGTKEASRLHLDKESGSGDFFLRLHKVKVIWSSALPLQQHLLLSKVWFFLFVLFEWSSQCLHPECPFDSTKIEELGVLRGVSASNVIGGSAWRPGQRELSWRPHLSFRLMKPTVHSTDPSHYLMNLGVKTMVAIFRPKYIHQNTLQGTWPEPFRVQQQGGLRISELTPRPCRSPNVNLTTRRATDLKGAPPALPAWAPPPRGLCCDIIDLCVRREGPVASLLGASTFSFHAFFADRLLPLGWGPRSVLQNIWNHLYSLMLKVPFRCPIFQQVFICRKHYSPEKSICKFIVNQGMTPACHVKTLCPCPSP